MVEGEPRVELVEAGGRRESLQPGGERGERVFELAQELEHLFPRDHVFHHHEAHEVQAEITRGRGRFDGHAEPGQVGRPAGLRRLVHATMPGRIAIPGQCRRQDQAFCLQAAQRRVQRPGAGLVDAHRRSCEDPLEVVAGRRRPADQAEQHVLERGELICGHDQQSTLPP